MRVLWLLMLLAGIAFAPTGVATEMLRDWRVYAITAAFISILASVLLLMLSRLLDLRQLETVFKAEMVFAASTVLLVLMLVTMVDLSENLLLGSGGGAGIMGGMLSAAYSSGSDIPPPATFLPDAKLTDVAILYITPMAKCSTAFIRVLYTLSIPSEAISTMYEEIFMSEQATGGGIKPLTTTITQATKLLTFYMLVYYILVHTLNFIKHYAMFFLSIGVVLRAFPPTRGAGAYLIAISLGLYFVFPFTFIFMSALSSTQMQGLVDVDLSAPVRGESFVCNLPEDVLGITAPQSCGVQHRASVKEAENWLDAYGSDYRNFLDVLFKGNFLGSLTANICFIPLIAMVAVISFVISTTGLFGGSIPEIGRGLVKLI